MLKKLLVLLFVSAGVLSVSAQVAPAADDANAIFKPLKWRSIGPFRGGRANAGTGVVGDPKTYYMGTTGGGVWKTDDSGITWRNISDGFFKTGTIGAIAVAESDPNVVYVGSGEHAIRGVMTHEGDGMYRSTDAGKTWKKIGLDASQHIARIIVHPEEPRRVSLPGASTARRKSAACSSRSTAAPREEGALRRRRPARPNCRWMRPTAHHTPRGNTAACRKVISGAGQGSGIHRQRRDVGPHDRKACPPRWARCRSR
jgi:hypothetical protein